MEGIGEAVSKRDLKQLSLRPRERAKPKSNSFNAFSHSLRSSSLNLAAADVVGQKKLLGRTSVRREAQGTYLKGRMRCEENASQKKKRNGGRLKKADDDEERESEKQQAKISLLLVFFIYTLSLSLSLARSLSVSFTYTLTRPGSWPP